MSVTYNKKPQTILVLQNRPLNLIIIKYSSLITSFDCPKIVLINKDPLVLL